MGGVPEDTETPGPWSTLPSVAGCIDMFRVNGLPVSLTPANTHRVDLSGCPSTVAPGVRFNGEGLAQFHLQEERLRTLTFNYRTSQLKALLLQTGNLTISVFHTKLRVDVFNASLLSAESGLSDNTHQSLLLEFEYSNNQTK